MFALFENAPSLPNNISVFFVTPESSSADQLSVLLGRAKVKLHVEWINSNDDHIETVRQKLALKNAGQRCVVLFDYGTCKATVWDVIEDCNKSMPELQVEWILTDRSGALPGPLPLFASNVTMIGQAQPRY